MIDFSEEWIPAGPDDLVSFAVICGPESKINYKQCGELLRGGELAHCLPDTRTVKRVKAQLKHLGFEVYTDPSPVVSARGPVKFFQSIFRGEVKKRIRHVHDPRRPYSQTCVVATCQDTDTAPPVDGALVIAPIGPALPLAEPAVAPAFLFDVHHPDEIAEITNADKVHQELVGGEPAKGQGIGVAVIDTGFAPHPYYSGRHYDISPIASADTTHPTIDDHAHGTAVLAPLLACAPEIHAYGIKMGPNPILAVDRALMFPVRVLSISWAQPVDETEPTLPTMMIALHLRLLTAIQSGVTVVAAAGNGNVAFPAMLPGVISVGGATQRDGDLFAWSDSSSFESKFFPGRQVPDIAGIAYKLLVPVPAPPDQPDWIATRGTSYAAPQVAAAAALLLQKNPKLTPADIRDELCNAATDITLGSASGKFAIGGRDKATGAGLVNAHAAWSNV